MIFKETIKNFDLSKKTALITGAGGLLGFEHAFALLDIGSNVILTDISEKKLDLTKKRLQINFPKSKILKLIMDVSNEKEILKASSKIKSLGFDVNILINNASIDPKVNKEKETLKSSTLEYFDLKVWEKEIAVGLTGAFLCSKIFGTIMSKTNSGGVILNISSDLSVFSPDQRIYKIENLKSSSQPVKPITYSVIKTGLIGLTRYLATYWADKNIRCNALSPGGVYDGQDKKFIERLTNLIPLGRMAEKKEYRSAVQFLCSDASSYLNGQNIVMDGGRSVW